MFEGKLDDPATIEEMVNVYKSACARIEAAYNVLISERDRLRATFGEHGNLCSFDTYGKNVNSYSDKPAQDVIKDLKREVWRQIINKTGARKLLSVKRAEDLDRNLRDGNLPEVETVEVIKLLEGLVNTAGDLVAEAAREAFDILRPARHEHNRELKTNQKNARYNIGPKVILCGYVEETWGGTGYRVNYYRDSDLTAVDRVFHALDGHGVPAGYRSPLIDAIGTCKDGQGETEYFRFKCYMNGNLHLEFRRMDLVAKLNAIGGDGTLKG